MAVLRRNVSFRTTIAFDRGGHPAGEEFARVLLTDVDAAVASSGRLEDWRDSGFELQYVLDGKPVHIAMSFVPDQRFEFYAQVASYAGWVRRLFGYRDQAAVEGLVRALHAALASSTSFNEIAWHSAWYDEGTMTAEP
jgi:hypothetical protein